MTEEVHYTKVKNWKWKFFTPKEIACKGDGLIVVNEDALNRLDDFREEMGAPVVLNSAYRSVAYNKSVGGAPGSQHLQGKAFDVRITPRVSREAIHRIAKLVGFTGFGDYDTFVHIDTGPSRYWDNRK